MNSQRSPNDGNIRRAMTLMTASSVLVPLAGLLTQPILAQGLGVQGRGELAAAVAPSALALTAATLGLPDALTYYLAKHPSITRAAVLLACGTTVVLGLLYLAGATLFLPFLSVGDSRLATYIVVALAITIPALVVGILRGAATGRQMWMTIAVERFVITGLRVIVLSGLLLTGNLTVLSAVVATALIPAISGAVYWKLFTGPGAHANDEPFVGPIFRTLISYGSRLWLGSVASMLLARTDQLLMAPLSSVQDLGIYSVAVTVSDLPLLVVAAMAVALMGVNSQSGDPSQVASVTRISTLVSLIGCIALGATVPFLMRPLFGADFEAAVVPSLMLILSALVSTPGVISSAGLSAHGRPGLRSIGFGLAFVVNVSVFVATVPHFGILGACSTSIVTAIVYTSFTLATTSRVLGVPISSFVLIRRSDLLRLRREATRLRSRLRY